MHIYTEHAIQASEVQLTHIHVEKLTLNSQIYSVTGLSIAGFTEVRQQLLYSAILRLPDITALVDRA